MSLRSACLSGPVATAVSLFMFSPAFLMIGAQTVQAQDASGRLSAKQDSPDIRVEFLGAESGYAVGTQSFSALCIVRNVGASTLPEGALRMRCYTLANLDYLNGQLRPAIPSLAPNQSVAFRWRLAPTNQSGPLTFAAFIERNEEAINSSSNSAGIQRNPSTATSFGMTLPNVRTASVPHFASIPKLLSGLGGWGKTPQAIAGDEEGWVGNDRIFVHAITASGNNPVLTLAAKDGSQWRQVAVIAPLSVVNSGEDGQRGWREGFRWLSSERSLDKDSATLTLIGAVGNKWSATLTLQAKRDTGSLNGRLKLTARKNIRCFGIQLPRLCVEKESSAPAPKADGAGQVLPPDPSIMAETERISASHSGALTFGIAWSSRSPFSNWRTSRLPVGDPERMEILGGEWASATNGEVALAGDVLEFNFRIFAFGPSFTVRDATRFALP